MFLDRPCFALKIDKEKLTIDRALPPINKGGVWLLQFFLLYQIKGMQIIWITWGFTLSPFLPRLWDHNSCSHAMGIRDEIDFISCSLACFASCSPKLSLWRAFHVRQTSGIIQFVIAATLFMRSEWLSVIWARGINWWIWNASEPPADIFWTFSENRSWSLACRLLCRRYHS